MPRGSSLPLVPGKDEIAAESLRGSKGFFRVGRTVEGVWWLLDPADRGFVAKAVAGVNRSGRASGHMPAASRYAERVVGLQGVESGDFMRGAVERLRGWHFNTLGAWSEPGELAHGMYFTEVLDFRRIGPCIHWLDMNLPDVFDRLWATAVEGQARALCRPLAENRNLVGYFTDDGLGWAQESRSASGDPRPTLLQICLSLEPVHCAYHAAWEYALAPHRGEVGALGRSWGRSFARREAIRQMTLAEEGIDHPLYWECNRGFTQEYARRYFSISSSAVRASDPNHLLLGARFEDLPTSSILVESAYPHADVFSVGSTRLDWAADVGALARACDMPVWFVRAGWASRPFLEMEKGCGATTPLERMLKRGRKSLQGLLEQRNVVGYEWGAWADREFDEPPFGRGLVRGDDRCAREHVDLLSAINQRADRLRPGDIGALRC